MALVLNGSTNTIAGLAVGGLPDGSVDTDTLAANAVTVAKASGSVKGISIYDTWQLGASKNWSGTNYLDSDFDRSTIMPQVGSGMTRSGTVMSFPSTGIWEITFILNSADGTENAYTQCWIQKTVNNGTNWSDLSSSLSNIPDDGSNTVYASSVCVGLVDVTDVSNVKVRLGTANEQGAYIRGSTTEFQTGVIFKRIGDT
jgi:hypothetical protein